MQTFLEYYEQKIQPQIAAIDLFLKTEEPPYDSDAVAGLLGVPASEWKELMQQEKVVFLTKGVFFQLMQRGSSPLCGMFRRAVEWNLPEEYTLEMVSYIFGIELDAVRRAASKLGQTVFLEKMLPQVFAEISLAETQYPF